MPDSIEEQIEDHLRVISAAAAHVELLSRIADRLVSCFEGCGKLFVFGNGGSAADAQHIAAELVGRFRKDRRPLPAIALTTDSSILTAVANDYGGEHCFARQVEALVSRRDVVWALSTSGNSANVLRGLDAARHIGAYVIGFSGRSGGAMRERCDVCFLADHERADRIQEAHQLAYHLICDRIERRYLR